MSFARTPSGWQRWNSRAYIPLHRHNHAYAALVLSGSYEESGSRGRFRAGPGDVLLHEVFEAHLDRFQKSGARIFSLGLQAWPSGPPMARVADPDRIVRTAERDAAEASALLLADLRARPSVAHDWQDMLAADLLSDPDWRLDDWARRSALAPATVSRGFRRIFGMTPAAFRLQARARRALTMVTASQVPLAAIAATTGFADQAHMSRAIRALTGAPPGRWRRSNPFKTEPVPAPRLSP